MNRKCECESVVDWGDGTHRCRMCRQEFVKVQEVQDCEFIPFYIDINAILDGCPEIKNRHMLLGTLRTDNIRL